VHYSITALQQMLKMLFSTECRPATFAATVRQPCQRHFVLHQPTSGLEKNLGFLEKVFRFFRF